MHLLRVIFFFFIMYLLIPFLVGNHARIYITWIPATGKMTLCMSELYLEDYSVIRVITG